MKNLIIGFGEIGKAIYQIIGGDTTVIDAKQGISGYSKDFQAIDVMHVCFPYSEDFVGDLTNYIHAYQPKHVVVYSTVPIGTVYNIHENIVHSPVEGKHPELEMSIRQMERWIGCNNKEEGFFFVNYFKDLGLHTKLVESTNYTEALKLLSTTEYGINLVFADYKARIAEDIGMPYELTKEWNKEYNKLYRNLGMDDRFKKYVLDAPNGKIGGHCVVPNAEILEDQYPDDLIDLILEMK
jgi:UDP-glucose 6-dehydrogenase